jgi:hypothetical protein
MHSWSTRDEQEAEAKRRALYAPEFKLEAVVRHG